MNKKGKGGGIFFLIIVVMIVLGVLFCKYGDKYEITQPYYQKLFNKQKIENVTTTVVGSIAEKVEMTQPPVTETDWCQIKELGVSTDQEEPARDQITGWDDVNKCCVREISGFNCALMRQSSVKYCWTADIGGEIAWAMIDAVYIDSKLISNYTADLDKIAIENKPLCDISKYPSLLR